MLLTSTLMQLLIINLPSGEQVSTLCFMLDADETLIGQSSQCQIRLPDQQALVAKRHARITREDDRWYLENLGSQSLTVNTTDIQNGFQQRYLLTDGDLITCGEYQLMVSDFSLWQTSSVTGLEKPSLDEMARHDAEYCAIPSNMPSKECPSIPENLDDPFELQESAETKDKQSSPPDIAMKVQPLSEVCSLLSDNQHGLIDILAEEDSEEEDDWSINRNLWPTTLKSGYSGSVPVLSERALMASEIEKQNRHRRSICQAMLFSLEQFVQDLSPENLSRQFKYGTKTPTDDYWSEYQKFYQRLVDEQSYRLLFLQRFRQALKQQEQH